jgi:hypothetical protein
MTAFLSVFRLAMTGTMQAKPIDYEHRTCEDVRASSLPFPQACTKEVDRVQRASDNAGHLSCGDTEMTQQTLSIKAGSRALAIVRDEGLDPGKIEVLAGAAGGPKWLVLYGIDRLVLADWIRRRQTPLATVGASIGSWRFAALARSDPQQALHAFKEAYIGQTYSEKPTPGEITAGSRKVMDAFLPDRACGELLDHPSLRAGILAVRCRHLTAREEPLLQGMSFTAAMAANLASRRLLRCFFERTLFQDPRGDAPFYRSGCFPTRLRALGHENVKSALLASGSIPLVMEGVRLGIGSGGGTYRDGGVLDYHLDLPWRTSADGLVLMPHYTDRIIPGWLDKKLAWRRPRQNQLQNLLMIGPSRDFIDSLPLGKIPDREDFYRFKGDDERRMQYWQRVAAAGEKMAEEFAETVESGRIRKRVQPLMEA